MSHVPRPYPTDFRSEGYTCGHCGAFVSWGLGYTYVCPTLQPPSIEERIAAALERIADALEAPPPPS